MPQLLRLWLLNYRNDWNHWKLGTRFKTKTKMSMVILKETKSWLYLNESFWSQYWASLMKKIWFYLIWVDFNVGSIWIFNPAEVTGVGWCSDATLGLSVTYFRMLFDCGSFPFAGVPQRFLITFGSETMTSSVYHRLHLPHYSSCSILICYRGNGRWLTLFRDSFSSIFSILFSLTWSL